MQLDALQNASDFLLLKSQQFNKQNLVFYINLSQIPKRLFERAFFFFFLQFTGKSEFSVAHLQCCNMCPRVNGLVEH